MQLGYGSRIFDGKYAVCHPIELLAATFDKSRKTDCNKGIGSPVGI
jgi:hypothetical protein